MNLPFISIIAPCFNESKTIISFLQSLEKVISKLNYHFQVIVIDDSSYDNTLSLLKEFSFSSSNISLHLLQLKFNSGHQNAIFQGLLYAGSLNQEYVIIMDGDGEDDPHAIPFLLEKKGYELVEVKRGQRRESIRFQVLYFFYKAIFRLITGKQMDYGNYCMLSNKLVEHIQITSFIHLPAYLLKQKINRASILFNRNKRIDGKSKMGYKNLFLHAFKSFVEFGDDLLLWFLRMFVVIVLLLIIISANLIYQKFIAHTAILGWFSTVSLGLVNLAAICIGFFVLGILMMNLMHNQNKSSKGIYTIIKKESI